MSQYAYIRVSTKEQNVDRQILALKPYHVPENNIYCDYQSGRIFLSWIWSFWTPGRNPEI